MKEKDLKKSAKIDFLALELQKLEDRDYVNCKLINCLSVEFLKKDEENTILFNSLTERL